MSKVEVLVGLPGSGKSTFVNSVFGEDPSGVFVYSTDDYIEAMADSYVEPELDEGFDYILVVDLFGNTIVEKGIKQ